MTARIRLAAARRARGEPLAYCVGTAAFRHLTLAVDQRVLIPRPETEIVVEHALRVCRQWPGGVAVDIGTGSGAIALSLATEGRFDHVIGTDISADALAVAAANAAALGGIACPVSFRNGADLTPLAARAGSPAICARVIVANPPYIAYSEAAALPSAVRGWEPTAALFAGDDGMARYNELLSGAATYLERSGWLVLELDARRADETQARALRAGYHDVRIEPDLSGRPRVLLARHH